MLGFLGLSKIQLIISAVIVASLLSAVGVLWLQNRGLRTDLQISEANNARLELAIQEQILAVEAAQENAAEWREAHERLAAIHEELQEVEKQSRSELRRLQSIFDRHDLHALGLAKPGRVERIINDGTSGVFRMLERLTSGDLPEASRAGDAAGETTGPGP